MGSNIRDFEIQLDQAAGEIDQVVEIQHRAVALEALKSVVMMSPVDTGLFRGNWQASDGEPPPAPVDSVDTSGGPTIGRGAEVIARARAYGRTWIANLLPYAQRLEDGYSQQAPAGMVAVTIARLRSMFA